jgi:capsular exopolysaccharide synthesis family protein
LLAREAKEEGIAEAYQKIPGVPDLYAIPAGPVPPNPAELIGSEQMLKLMSVVTGDFAHVIVDSPPVAAFTDGVLIGSMVEGVLLVVHSGKSSRKVVARARRLLRDVGARIIGVVLNKVQVAPENSYYYYSGYYQNYHSDEPETQVDAAVGT